jgi:hypothetical protein
VRLTPLGVVEQNLVFDNWDYFDDVFEDKLDLTKPLSEQVDYVAGVVHEKLPIPACVVLLAPMWPLSCFLDLRVLVCGRARACVCVRVCRCVHVAVVVVARGCPTLLVLPCSVVVFIMAILFGASVYFAALIIQVKKLSIITFSILNNCVIVLGLFLIAAAISMEQSSAFFAARDLQASVSVGHVIAAGHCRCCRVAASVPVPVVLVVVVGGVSITVVTRHFSRRLLSCRAAQYITGSLVVSAIVLGIIIVAISSYGVWAAVVGAAVAKLQKGSPIKIRAVMHLRVYGLWCLATILMLLTAVGYAMGRRARSRSIADSMTEREMREEFRAFRTREQLAYDLETLYTAYVPRCHCVIPRMLSVHILCPRAA